MSKPIETDEEALTLALALAIVAPDDFRAEKMTQNAIVLSRSLDEVTVARCKQAALVLVEEWEELE